LGRFTNALCKNRKGQFFLPYHDGWRSEYWSDHITSCGGHEALDTRDKEIADVGLEIGIRCQRVWEDIRIQEQVGPLPVMCAALIAQINYRFAETKINEDIATSVARSGDDQSNGAAGEAINTEMLTDIMSDYIFSRMKSGSILSTTLDLSSVLNNYSIHSHATGLQDLLYIIAFFKFVFDQLLFLDSVVTVEGNRIICRIPSGGLSETYFALSRLSKLAESLILGNIDSKRPASLPLTTSPGASFFMSLLSCGLSAVFDADIMNFERRGLLSELATLPGGMRSGSFRVLRVVCPLRLTSHSERLCALPLVSALHNSGQTFLRVCPNTILLRRVQLRSLEEWFGQLWGEPKSFQNFLYGQRCREARKEGIFWDQFPQEAP